jgi:hypothetical protein
MLPATAGVSGLAKVLSDGLAPWQVAPSVHDDGETVLDLVVAIALGGDCLAAWSVPQPKLFGPVACDPTVTRLIHALGGQAAEAITTIRTAAAGQCACSVASHAFADDRQLVVGLSQPDRGRTRRGNTRSRPQARGRVPPDAHVRRPRFRWQS